MLIVATATFIALVLPLGLHRDDVGVMEFVSHSSYGDVWSSPFMDLFYRPLVVTIAKLGSDAFGPGPLPLRIVQGILVAVSVFTFIELFRAPVSSFARSIGGMCLLASPMTFVTVTPFAVGVADTIVLLMFLASARFALASNEPDAKTDIWLLCISLVAVLAKESGLLVVAFCFLERARRRRWAASIVLLCLAGAYLGLRSAFVHVEPFAFESGFFFDMYSNAELRARFGDFPYLFYAYNVVGNLTSALCGLPVKGQLHLTPLFAFLFAVLALTSFLTGRYLLRSRSLRQYAPFLAIIVFNALLGYMYVRARIMFVSYAVIAVLFTVTLDDLWRRPQRLLGLSGRTVAVAIALLWLGVWVTSIARLRIQAAAAI